MPWKKKPIEITNWDTSKFDNLIFIDERGTSDTKYIKKMLKKSLGSPISIDANIQYLTLCACIINKNDFPGIKGAIKTLKSKHWPTEGKFKYKKFNKTLKQHMTSEKVVVLHHSEIKSKRGAFYKHTIDHQVFGNDLENFLKNSNYTLIAVTIDKHKLVTNPCYHQNKDPYHVAYEFLLERIGFHFNEINQNGSIINEFRGMKENKSLLKFILSLLNNGNYHLNKTEFSKIEGIYFNSKRDATNQKSYFGLEIVDQVLPSISNFLINNSKDSLFNNIENKIRCYPRYKGKGLKFYP